MKKKFNPMYQLLDSYIKPQEKNTLSLATLDILSKSAETFSIIRQPNFSVFTFNYPDKKELYIHREGDLSFTYVNDEHGNRIYRKPTRTEKEILDIAKQYIDMEQRAENGFKNFRIHDAMGFYSNLLAILPHSFEETVCYYDIYPENRDMPSYTIISDSRMKLSKNIYMVYRKPSQNDFPDFNVFMAKSCDDYYNNLDCKELMFLNRNDLIELMKNNY